MVGRRTARTGLCRGPSNSLYCGLNLGRSRPTWRARFRFNVRHGSENIEHKKIAIQGEEPLREWARTNAAAWFTIADDELTDALGGLIPEIDAVALNEHGMAAVWASSIRRSLQNGIDGYIDDSLVFCKHWGFRPDDIEVPVTVWQGDLDLMVPFTHGQWLIKHIPQAKSQLELGHGHISLIVDKKQAIINDLLGHLPASK